MRRVLSTSRTKSDVSGIWALSVAKSVCSFSGVSAHARPATSPSPPSRTGLPRERLSAHCSLLNPPRFLGLRTTLLSHAHGSVSGSSVALAWGVGRREIHDFRLHQGTLRRCPGINLRCAAVDGPDPRPPRVHLVGRRSRVRPPVCARHYPPRSDARKQMQGMIIRNGKLSYRSCLADSFRSGLSPLAPAEGLFSTALRSRKDGSHGVVFSEENTPSFTA